MCPKSQTRKIGKINNDYTKAQKVSHLEDQALPYPTGGVVRRILFLAQTPRPHKCDRNSIPKNHLDSRRRHRSKIERAQLTLQRQMHIQISDTHQTVGLHRRHGYQVNPLGLRAGHELQQFLGIPTLTEHNEQILGRQNADVAVKRVDRG